MWKMMIKLESLQLFWKSCEILSDFLFSVANVLKGSDSILKQEVNISRRYDWQVLSACRFPKEKNVCSNFSCHCIRNVLFFFFFSCSLLYTDHFRQGNVSFHVRIITRNLSKCYFSLGLPLCINHMLVKWYTVCVNFCNPVCVCQSLCKSLTVLFTNGLSISSRRICICN